MKRLKQKKTSCRNKKNLKDPIKILKRPKIKKRQRKSLLIKKC